MATGYVLYNPLAGNGAHISEIKLLELVLPDPLELRDMTRITNYGAFLSGMTDEDYLILAGGDGTLNRFVNDTAGLQIRQEILYYPIGSGNDFARDFGKRQGCNPFPIGDALRDLPRVMVNGKTFRFLNGVGYGIDGYCCAVGDELRKIPGKTVNYSSIAIRGLLLHYKPTQARVTVDGVAHTYEKVWLAPTMHGRCYGGGMMPAPEQNRDGTLSVMVFHGSGKLRTLMIFPSIFKGTHVKYKKYVQILKGREITVEYDRPTPLQIDGETVTGVTSYTACAARAAVHM